MTHIWSVNSTIINTIAEKLKAYSVPWCRVNKLSMKYAYAKPKYMIEKPVR